MTRPPTSARPRPVRRGSGASTSPELASLKRPMTSPGMTSPGTNTFGIDLGGTNVRCAVVDDAGRVLADVRDATPDGWERVVATMAALVNQLATEHAVHAVGVGAAGLCDRDGVVRYAPNIPGLVNAPLSDALAA